MKKKIHISLLIGCLILLYSCAKEELTTENSQKTKVPSRLVYTPNEFLTAPDSSIVTSPPETDIETLNFSFAENYPTCFAIDSLSGIVTLSQTHQIDSITCITVNASNNNGEVQAHLMFYPPPVENTIDLHYFMSNITYDVQEDSTLWSSGKAYTNFEEGTLFDLDTRGKNLGFIIDKNTGEVTHPAINQGTYIFSIHATHNDLKEDFEYTAVVVNTQNEYTVVFPKYPIPYHTKKQNPIQTLGPGEEYGEKPAEITSCQLREFTFSGTIEGVEYHDIRIYKEPQKDGKPDSVEDPQTPEGVVCKYLNLIKGSMGHESWDWVKFRNYFYLDGDMTKSAKGTVKEVTKISPRTDLLPVGVYELTLRNYKIDAGKEVVFNAFPLLKIYIE